MKRWIGIIITLIGILCLINPTFTYYEWRETINYFTLTYWPLILIFIGVYMQSNSKKKRR